MNTFKKELSDLSEYALEISGLKNEYKDEDMINATLVFMEVFSSLAFDNYKDKLTQEQLEMLFEEAGKSLRQTIKLFTGIDTIEFFNKDK